MHNLNKFLIFIMLIIGLIVPLRVLAMPSIESASSLKTFDILFGKSSIFNPTQAILQYIAPACDHFNENHISYPAEEIAQMCAFRTLYIWQYETEKYVLSEASQILLPTQLGLESFRRGILNLNYEFSETRLDGFVLYSSYIIRKSAMGGALDDILSVLKKWGGNTAKWQADYAPAIQSSLQGGLDLTKLLRVGLESHCTSQYFSCRQLDGLSEEQTSAAYLLIVKEVASMQEILNHYPDSELAQVRSFRAKLIALVQSLQLTEIVDARSLVEGLGYPTQKSTALEAAVVEANAIFAEIPPERIARFFIYLEELDELSNVLSKILQLTKPSVEHVGEVSSHFLLKDVFEKIKYLNVEIRK